MRITVSSVFFLAIGISVCQAQTPPPAGNTSSPTPLPDQPLPTVTVTAPSQSDFRGTIDRRSYAISKDLQASNGTIGDVLKNIPSVTVDVQGNVSLRGDANVVIMIDGKVSGLFKGPGAALALQSMGADNFERVEIITNPSSEFSAEGSAGIVNLITKQTHKVGETGSVRFNVGTQGRKNVALNGTFNNEKLTVSGDIGARDDGRDQASKDQRTTYDAFGSSPTVDQSNAQGHAGYSQWNGRAGIEYIPNNKTQLSGEFRYSGLDRTVLSIDNFEISDPITLTNSPFYEPAMTVTRRNNDATQLTLNNNFAQEGHELTINISHEYTWENRVQAFSDVPVDVQSESQSSRLDTLSELSVNELKVDYKRPMALDGILKIGYDFRVDQDSYRNVDQIEQEQIPVSLGSNNLDIFHFKQVINSGYMTYEQPCGMLTAQIGLRLENVDLMLDQKSSGIEGRPSYGRVYPSIHLSYKLSKAQELNASFSQRVQRPSPQDFNPYRIQLDTLDFRQGNTSLLPQITNVYEVGYQFKAGSNYYQASAFYRDNRHVISDVLVPLTSGAELSTKENIASSTSGGVELVRNGEIAKALSYNISVIFASYSINAAASSLEQFIGAANSHSIFSSGGRGSVTWNITPKDSLQLNAQINGKQLLPQGYLSPTFEAFLGYRHQIDDRISALVTFQDIFNSYRFNEYIRSPLLSEHSAIFPNSRGIFVGFTWNFGGGAHTKPSQPAFDFDN